MRKKKNQQQDEGFFIETIDLSPSNNITPPPSNSNYGNQPAPSYDAGMSERIKLQSSIYLCETKHLS